MQPTAQQTAISPSGFPSGDAGSAAPDAPPAQPLVEAPGAPLNAPHFGPPPDPFIYSLNDPPAEALKEPARDPFTGPHRAPPVAALVTPWEASLDDPSPAAWRRWFARSFDVWLHTGLVALLIGYVLCRFSPTFLRWLETPFGWKLFGLVCVPLGFLLEAGVHAIAGNTPGKALLGLRVVTIDGRTPRGGEILARNMGVWGAGLGFGLPFVSLFTMARQGWRLYKGLPASYDCREFLLRVVPVSWRKRLAFGALFSTLFVVISALDLADRQEGREMAAVRAASSYSWTNPETGYPANIASQWKYETLLDEDGSVLHLFTQHSEHAVILLASEALGDTPLRQYTQALTERLSGQVQVTSGYFEDFRGTQSWVGAGEDKEGAARVQLRVVQVHGQVWRVMVRQSPPFGYTDELVRDLTGELWVTVAPR